MENSNIAVVNENEEEIKEVKLTDRIKNPFIRFLAKFFIFILKTILFIVKVIFTFVVIGCLTAILFTNTFFKYLEYNVFKNGEADVVLMDIPVNLSSTVYYLDKESNEWVEWCKLDAKENRTWTSFNDIPKNFINSFVAIEDQRFWSHPGVDWRRTGGAILSMFKGGKIYGGSTITQQLLKNVTHDNEVTIKRKIIEICRALKIEQTYNKKDILEWYLNIIYFGRHNYGIAEASNYYFNKDASELTLAQTCCITGITNNPSMYDPYLHFENNKKRQEIILNKMCELGYIDSKTCEEAKKEEIVFYDHSNDKKNENVTVYPYYVDTLIEDVLDEIMNAFQVDYRQAQSMLFNGGYSIYSCVDIDVQNKMDEVYRDTERLKAWDKDGESIQSGMVVIDPYTGDIVGIEGGIGEKKISRGLNWATSGMARRPLGSSIKPLSVYGPALEYGVATPDTLFFDGDNIKLENTNWYPNNVNLKHNGVVTTRFALVNSLNTIAAQITDLLGPDLQFELLRTKFHMNLERSDNDYAPMSIGQLSIGTTPREVASAYTVFPNNGVYSKGRTYLKVIDSNGDLLFDNEVFQDQVFNEKTVYWINDMLKEAITSGTGYEAKLDEMICAGKTGTTQSKRDKWFAGYTPYYVGVVWSGYENPKRLDSDANPSCLTWKAVMDKIHENLEVKDFNVPEDVELEPIEYQMKERPSSQCYIKGVDENGNELYNESVGYKWIYDTVTLYAKELDGYSISGHSKQTIEVKYNSYNGATFKYVKNEVPVAAEPIQTEQEVTTASESSESSEPG